jgi:ParB-like chromosome segregation protein Spo0J
MMATAAVLGGTDPDAGGLCMQIGERETHPAADAFPLLTGPDFDGLVDDIKRNGLLEAIVQDLDERILDGRNRLRACEAAGVEPRFVVYNGDDPISFVVSKNFRRRHMNESQRAMVAAKLATLPRGRRAKSDTSAGLTRAGAAELMNVGEGTVAAARTVLEHAVPEVVSAVERGEMSVTAAAELAKHPASKQRELAAIGEPKTVRAAAVRERQAQNDEMPTAEAARKQLVHTITRALEQLGASIDSGHLERAGGGWGIRLAYGGRIYDLAVTQLEEMVA